MLWQFVVASMLIELTPGPNMTWLAVTGANHGRKVALSAVAGICIGLAIAAVVAGLGLTALLIEFPALFQVLRWAGALYLLYLAWDAWRVSDDSPAARDASSAAAFRQGLVTNVLNPKAYLFYAAMLPQFLSPAQPSAAQIALLSAIYIAIATIIHAVIAGLAGSAADFLRTSPHAVTLRCWH
jgi:threonine/homoserine/homoserine lactone efflux protein